MMDMFIQHSQDTGRADAQTKYVSNPNLLGQTEPISILPLKEHSTLIYIYQDLLMESLPLANPAEIRTSI